MLYNVYVVTVANREECAPLEPVELQNLLDQVLEGCARGYLAEVRGADDEAGADEDGGTDGGLAEHFAQGAGCEPGDGTHGTHGTHGTDAGEDTADGTPVECGAQGAEEGAARGAGGLAEHFAQGAGCEPGNGTHGTHGTHGTDAGEDTADGTPGECGAQGGDAALAPDVPQWVENLRLRVADKTMSIYEFRNILQDCRLKAVHVCRFAGIAPTAYSRTMQTGKLSGPDRNRLMAAFGVTIAGASRQ